MRKYLATLTTDRTAYVVAVPAESEDKAIEYCQGNGEIISLNDVTDKYKIDVDRVREALKNGNFSDIQIDFMVRTLTETNIIE